MARWFVNGGSFAAGTGDVAVTMAGRRGPVPGCRSLASRQRYPRLALVDGSPAPRLVASRRQTDERARLTRYAWSVAGANPETRPRWTDAPFTSSTPRRPRDGNMRPGGAPHANTSRLYTAPSRRLGSPQPASPPRSSVHPRLSGRSRGEPAAQRQEAAASREELAAQR